jgi:hypothetical protein
MSRPIGGGKFPAAVIELRYGAIQFDSLAMDGLLRPGKSG